jgi:hypothetical protein
MSAGDGRECGPFLTALRRMMEAREEQMFSTVAPASVQAPDLPARRAQRGWIMIHTTWDLEVIARDLQERRMREAARQQRIAAATRSGHVHESWLGKMLTRARGVLSRPEPDSAMQPLPNPAQAAAVLPTTSRPSKPEERRRPHHAEPYAEMAVIARGQSDRRAKEPCHVADC